MTGQVYEVHVSAQHWAEGCDEDSPVNTCPVYRAMAEAGLPVEEVFTGQWKAVGDRALRSLGSVAGRAVWQFDEFRHGEADSLPDPITFYVELS